MDTPEIIARRRAVGVMYVLFGTMLFAAKGIVIKLSYRYGITALPLLSLRMLFALPFYLGMAVWARRQNMPALTVKQHLSVAGLGLLSYYISSYFDLTGLQYISAGLERLVLYVYPTLVVVIMAVWQKRRIRAMEWAILSVSYIGMILVFVHDLRLAKDWHATVFGGGMVLISTISFAFFVAFAGKVIPQVGSVRFTAYAMLAACTGVLLHNITLGEVSLIGLPVPVYVLALILAFFCTVIPSLLMNEGIRRVGSAPAALLGVIGPVVTLFLGWGILHESVGVIQIIGAILVIGGVVMTSRWSVGAAR